MGSRLGFCSMEIRRIKLRFWSVEVIINGFWQNIWLEIFRVSCQIPIGPLYPIYLPTHLYSSIRVTYRRKRVFTLLPPSQGNYYFYFYYTPGIDQSIVVKRSLPFEQVHIHLLNCTATHRMMGKVAGVSRLVLQYSNCISGRLVCFYYFYSNQVLDLGKMPALSFSPDSTCSDHITNSAKDKVQRRTVGLSLRYL